MWRGFANGGLFCWGGWQYRETAATNFWKWKTGNDMLILEDSVLEVSTKLRTSRAAKGQSMNLQTAKPCHRVGFGPFPCHGPLYFGVLEVFSVQTPCAISAGGLQLAGALPDGVPGRGRRAQAAHHDSPRHLRLTGALLRRPH